MGSISHVGFLLPQDCFQRLNLQMSLCDSVHQSHNQGIIISSRKNHPTMQDPCSDNHSRHLSRLVLPSKFGTLGFQDLSQGVRIRLDLLGVLLRQRNCTAHVFFMCLSVVSRLAFSIYPTVCLRPSCCLSGSLLELRGVHFQKLGCQSANPQSRRTDLVASLLLVAMPGAPSSFLLLVVRPGAPSSVLAPSSKARSP